jgi:hypothetical protein
MHIAMSNAMALLLWHVFRLLPGDFSFIWLLIGILLAFVVISALVMEAALALEAPHRRHFDASGPVNVSESRVTMSPSQTNLDDPDTPT